LLPAVLLGLVGLLVGPLLGIAVDRLVEREAFVAIHRCQRCRADLGGARALLPLVSWTQRCPTEPSHSRWRYPVVDLAAASSFALAGWRFGFTWQLWPYVAFFAALVVMLVIDIEHHLLLNVLTYPTLLVGAFMVLVLSGVNDYSEAMNPALISAVAIGVFFLVMHLVYPPGLGLGDVKLVPSLGLFLGWLTVSVPDALRLVLWTMIGALFGAGVVGMGIKAWARRQPPERFADQPEDWIPGEVSLGPFLAVATVVAIGLTQPASLGG
jgi:leader peptidase (prepilin peptidase)/N-methyltransferase